MSIPEPLKSRTWEIVVAFATLVFCTGGAYMVNSYQNSEQDRRIGTLERQMEIINKIDHRLSNIEGRMGIQTIDSPLVGWSK